VVGNVAALLMGADGGFITGSRILMDGGVTAAYWYGELAPDDLCYTVAVIDCRNRLSSAAFTTRRIP
jgi:hypothetical protein